MGRQPRAQARRSQAAVFTVNEGPGLAFLLCNLWPTAERGGVKASGVLPSPGLILAV